MKNIWYFAPDLLEWENLGINYAEFLSWACGSGLIEFYQSFLWVNIDSIFCEVDANQAILLPEEVNLKGDRS